jgi:drug/metabolite transporter (DMT)-like permease
MVLAASWLIWKHRALWRWLAVLGAVAGVLLVLGAAFPLEHRSMGVLFAARFAGFLALVIFIVASSLAMLLERGKEGGLMVEVIRTAAGASCARCSPPLAPSPSTSTGWPSFKPCGGCGCRRSGAAVRRHA